MVKKKLKKKTAKKTKVIIPEIMDSGPTAASSKTSSHLPVTTDPLALYLAEIRKYPLLSKEEEHEVAVRYYETGDAEAAEKLVTSNLRFVVNVAAEYSKFGAKMIDLVQEGNIGLMHAVREFNPYHGVRLITYAVWWIKGYIRDYLLRHYSLVRIGTTAEQKKLFYQLQKEQQKLEALGKELDVALLSSRLGVSEEAIEDMNQRLAKDISLDQPLDNESANTLIDLQKDADYIPVDEELAKLQQTELLREKVEAIKPHLNEKEIYILEQRILSDEPQTLQQIGDHFGITRERSRQLEARVIEKIKKEFVENASD